MAQPFTFPPPPPPPPPPKPSQGNFQSNQNFRGGQRGRGDSHSVQSGRGRGRGRGQHTRGSQRGGYGSRGARAGAGAGTGGGGGGGGGLSHSRGGYNPSSPPSQGSAQQQNSGSLPYGAQKRTHATAFQHRQDPSSTSRTHRPLAPPAVPSFGLDLESLLPKKPESSLGSAAPAPKKVNLLGLTPTTRDHDSDESDDEGEESKLAGNITLANSQLQFEYKGQTSSLTTAEEVAAWISERRKRWPTEEKREIARKEAEDRRKRWEHDKAARVEASKAAAKARQEAWQQKQLEKEKSIVRQKLLRDHILKTKSSPQVTGSSETRSAAEIKAERLRRKAEKVAKQLQIAEAALDGTRAAGPAAAADDTELESLLERVDQVASAKEDPHNMTAVKDSDVESDASDNSSSSSDAVMNEDTSSSGSSSDSDTDSDGPPSEFSSKRPVSSLQAPRSTDNLSSQAPTATADRPVCVAFAKTGRCKYGRRCHFKHDKRATMAGKGGGSGRKSLYQIMVEKEKEEEQRRTLQAIIALGDAGLLDASQERRQ